MALDPSVILGAKPLQLDSPLQNMTQALTIKSLANRNQIEGQSIADDQATRDAIKNNVTVGPDGQQTVDRKGTITDLMQKAPMKAMDLQTTWRQQDMAQQAAQLKQMQDQQAITSQVLMGVRDQASLADAKQTLLRMGVRNADKLPDVYDPQQIQSIQYHALTYKEQLDQQNKQTELGLKAKEVGAKNQQDTQSLLQTSRQVGPVQQAEKDLYSADKADSLVRKVGTDPNKMDPTMFKLYSSEIGKIATGGVPTVEELKGLDPKALTGEAAKAWESVSASPTPANLGEFIKQYQNYTGALRGDAMRVVKQNNSRIIESKKRLLDPSDYQKLNEQYVSPFEQKPEDETKAPKPKWAL